MTMMYREDLKHAMANMQNKIIIHAATDNLNNLHPRRGNARSSIWASLVRFVIRAARLSDQKRQ
jgi:hypothetical protein